MRQSSMHITAGELRILKVLWDLRSGTVRDVLERLAGGEEDAMRKLAQIVTYAMAVNVFFVCMELFTALYSDIPEHVHHFQYLFMGLEGETTLAPWMWVSSILAIVVSMSFRPIFAKIATNAAVSAARKRALKAGS